MSDISGGERLDPPLSLNEPPRAVVTASGGWGGILFGLVFVGVGSFIILVAADVVHARPGSIHVPRWTLGLAGMLFLLPGLWVTVGAAIAWLRALRAARGALTFAHEPWRVDHHWNMRESRARPLRGVGGALFGLVFCGLFFGILVGIRVQTRGEAPPPVVFWGAGGILGLMGLFALGFILLAVARRLRYGVPRLLFDRFPFHPGEDVRLRLPLPRSLPADWKEIRCTLRMVEERIVYRGVGRNRSARVQPFLLWRETVTITREGAPPGGGDIPLVFHPPEDLPGTRLSTSPPRYWELVAEASVAGPDFRAVFLVPVYDRGA